VSGALGPNKKKQAKQLELKHCADVLLTKYHQ